MMKKLLFFAITLLMVTGNAYSMEDPMIHPRVENNDNQNLSKQAEIMIKKQQLEQSEMIRKHQKAEQEMAKKHRLEHLEMMKKQQQEMNNQIRRHPSSEEEYGRVNKIMNQNRRNLPAQPPTGAPDIS